jgi:hypothetical protein
MTTDELQRISDFVYREPCPDRSGEIAALVSEVELLRHRVMCLEFEVSARSAANAVLRAEIDEFRQGVERDRDRPGV